MFLKKAAARFTAGVLAASALVTPALAVNATVNTGSDRLNLRAQASTSSSVLTKLSGGTVVEILAEEHGWTQVSYNGVTGFVSSEYLDVAEAATPAPAEETPVAEVTVAEAAEPETAEAAESTAEEETVYGRVTATSLNVRSTPSTSADKCGKLRAGSTVEILEALDGWYRIAEGYISADYVNIIDADAAADTASQVVSLALSYLGSRYVYGGSSPSGFDCSGFTSYIYKQFGISLNRSAAGQLDNGTPVAMSELMPGDLVLFKKAGTGSKRASHVGIYIGNNQFVHASTYNVGVIVSDMDYAYYTTGFVGGRRLL